MLTPEAKARLTVAVMRNCGCDPDNLTKPPCEAHQMLDSDKALQRFAYIDATRKRFMQEERTRNQIWRTSQDAA